MGATGEEWERYRRLDGAIRDGQFNTLVAELGDVEGFPNVSAHDGIGSCLIHAIYHGPVSLIRALLEAGADPDWVPDHDGYPPLIAALSARIPAPGARTRDDVDELLALLLDAGADVGQRGINDYTPLHLAAEHGHLATVELLLTHGADPNAITRIDEMETAMELAESAGHPEVVERLRPITSGPDWQRASRDGDVAQLERILRAGYDIDATDGFSQTALMRAAHAGRMDAVKWLVESGAELDHTAKFHLSALMLAALGGHARVAQALVMAGADTKITGTGAPGFGGFTAADLADQRSDSRLATWIHEHTR